MSLPPFRLRERLAASRGQPQAYFQGKRQKDLLGKMSAREAQVCDDGRRRRGLGRGGGVRCLSRPLSLCCNARLWIPRLWTARLWTARLWTARLLTAGAFYMYRLPTRWIPSFKGETTHAKCPPVPRASPGPDSDPTRCVRCRFDNASPLQSARSVALASGSADRYAVPLASPARPAPCGGPLPSHVPLVAPPC